ncbi:hypothetical protein A8C56_01990 [Niabella ginsenosidivorans]|uniref:Histidine kinase n=1 Tax=Niabella ginsenosidivorans TaxID=1176587 RepID=A0A1A9HWX9_9BACT|nr:DUF72 domain-containing protein [Niabella ginsenosidivorans]ANH79908.1 hypothetical protein A8C56_01990 [Niabella ginsenosidivorans]
MKWYIGCSGFSYKEWKGHFYPEPLAQKNWFTYYCTQFNSIEINSSFYRTPSSKSLKNWYTGSPESFLFSLKVPRLITHLHQLKNCEDLLTDFYQHISKGLKEKLGILLMQFPPKFSYTDERLELLINSIAPHMKVAVEFRHDSWFRQPLIKELGKQHIVFCGQSYPGNIPDTVFINASTAYYRFHGKPVLYKSAYPQKTLKKVFETIHAAQYLKEAYVFFNNTWGTAAIENARQFAQWI